MRSLSLLLAPDGSPRTGPLPDMAYQLTGICWLDIDLRRQLESAWRWVLAGSHATTREAPR